MRPLVCVVTGCSSGFGRAMTLRFLREGWHVIATVRTEADQADLEREAETLRQAGGRLTVVSCDITRETDRGRLRAAVEANGATLDALVNNAGTAYPGPVELLPLADLRAQFEVNVVAHVGVTQALLPFLKAARGAIVNVGSVSGRITSPGLGAYSASKFALEAISDALRLELAPFGLRVVIVEPGSSPTAIWNTSRARSASMAEHAADAFEPYRRLVEALRKRADTFSASGFPPADLADLVYRIVTDPSPKPRYALPGEVRRLLLLRRLLPDRWLDRLIRRNLGW